MLPKLDMGNAMAAKQQGVRAGLQGKLRQGELMLAGPGGLLKPRPTEEQ